MIIKYTIWSLKNLGKPLNINAFRFQLYNRIKADECYKSKRIFNLKWKKNIHVCTVIQKNHSNNNI